MIARLIAASLVAICATAPAADGPLEPTGKWLVDFDDEQCVAQRNYGSSEKPSYFVVKPSPTGNVVQIAIIDDGTRYQAVETEATLTFDRGKPLETTMIVYPNDGVIIHSIMLTSEQAAPLKDAKEITVQSRWVNKRLALSSMASLIKMMDVCVKDLQDYWNIGDQFQSRLKERARGDVRSLFTADDYPSVAVSREEEGSARFLLLIDEKGVVRDCTLVETSGVASLDAMGCQVIRSRGKFRPAIGQDGKPARDSYHTPKVVWRLE